MYLIIVRLKNKKQYLMKHYFLNIWVDLIFY